VARRFGARGRTAVILAGGKGTRLSPYTAILPKPLMPIGDQAILEIVISQLRAAGFTNLHLAVGHLGHLIRAVLADGQSHGVDLEYHLEATPLGTVGPLAHIPGLDEPFLMLNGDVLSTIDFDALHRAHVASGHLMTIATYSLDEPTEFGVIDLDGGLSNGLRRVQGFREKPSLRYTVSTGVYMLDPAVLQYVPAGEPSDVPDLIARLLGAGETIGAFEHDGFWLDIGRPQDFQRANREHDEIHRMLFGEDPPQRPLRVFVCTADGSASGPPALALPPSERIRLVGHAAGDDAALCGIALDPPDVVLIRLGDDVATGAATIAGVSEVAPCAGVVALAASPPETVFEHIDHDAMVVLPLDAAPEAVDRAIRTAAEIGRIART
jgi:NDP-mannose synthase